MARHSPRAALELKRARLALLQAPLQPGEKPAPDRAQRIAALEEEIADLQTSIGGFFSLPPRRDIDGPPDDPPDL